MSKKVKFVPNGRGMIKLMQSDEMRVVLGKFASDIRNRCGEGYAQDSHVGKTRANAMVWPDTKEARKDNLDNNTLLKARG